MTLALPLPPVSIRPRSGVSRPRTDFSPAVKERESDEALLAASNETCPAWGPVEPSGLAERGCCGDAVAPRQTGVLSDFDDDEEFGDDEDVVRPIGDMPEADEEDDFDEEDFDDDFDDDFESYDYEEEIVEEGSEIAEESDIDLDKVLAGETIDEDAPEVPLDEIAADKEAPLDPDAEEDEEEEEDDFDDE